ncbi:hypothetical protein CFIO01_11449 [Colletotrichum fioriniae PJ7]|uniref:Uncharacterized protein n=1 Tax=Colletotrichum fioriniae PJ7 TaxID=1445577 RepID=A0A010Q9R9_9PEZI|nr:hypothetical protein CFIO01_11449 [Colletotrichum fioriniae PJ7]
MTRLTTSVQTPNGGREVWCLAAYLVHRTDWTQEANDQRRSMFVGVLPSTDFDVSYYWTLQVGMRKTSINGPNTNASKQASKPWAPASSSPRPPPLALSSIVCPVMEVTRPGWREEREENVWRSGRARGGDLEAGPKCMHRAPKLP